MKMKRGEVEVKEEEIKKRWSLRTSMASEVEIAGEKKDVERPAMENQAEEGEEAEKKKKKEEKKEKEEEKEGGTKRFLNLTRALFINFIHLFLLFLLCSRSCDSSYLFFSSLLSSRLLSSFLISLHSLVVVSLLTPDVDL